MDFFFFYTEKTDVFQVQVGFLFYVPLIVSISASNMNPRKGAEFLFPLPFGLPSRLYGEKKQQMAAYL